MKLMQTNKAIGGFHLGYLTDQQLITRTMSQLLELYRQGKIKPRIDSCYHFEEVSSITLQRESEMSLGIHLVRRKRHQSLASVEKHWTSFWESALERCNTCKVAFSQSLLLFFCNKII